MANRALEATWKLLTGTPWTTGRSMVAEFGPPPHSLYASELAKFKDEELIAHGDKILAAIVRRRKVASKHQAAVQAGLKKELQRRIKRASPAARRKAGVR